MHVRLKADRISMPLQRGGKKRAPPPGWMWTDESLYIHPHSCMDGVLPDLEYFNVYNDVKETKKFGVQKY